MMQWNCCLWLALAPVYCGLTATALVSPHTPLLRFLSQHGKTRIISTKKKAPPPSLARVWNVTVPKRWFTHFYVMGLFNAVVVLRRRSIDVPSVLLLLHLSRRLMECLLVHKWSTGSKMHLAGYLLGILHYLMLPWVFYSKRSSIQGSEMTGEAIGRPPQQDDIWVATIIILNVYFQFQQYRHHYILAQLRRNQETTSNSSTSYQIPTEGWFRWITCPHYLAEIGIYGSFALLLSTEPQPPAYNNCLSTTMISNNASLVLMFGFQHVQWFLFTWVASNLSVAAQSSHQWYRLNLSALELQGRKALIIPAAKVLRQKFCI